MTSVNEKTFSKVLNGVIKSAAGMRDNLQALIVFGLEQYSEHRNASYLSSVLNKCIGVKSIPTVTIKEYIKAHANIKWVKLSDGTHGFKMAEDNPNVVMPEITWYDWKDAKHNKVTVDMDAMAQAKRLFTALTKALKEGHVKDKEKAEAIKAALEPLLA